jgi:hypothetical protein
MALPRYIREAGLRAVENKLAEIFNPTSGSLKASKTKQLGSKSPEIPIPKVVSFPST